MRWRSILASGAVLSAALAGSMAWAAQVPAEPPQPPPQPQAAPPPNPKDILEGACVACHGIDFIAEHRKSRDDWDFTVHRMIDKGAELTPDETDVLVDYLARTYPAEAKPAPPAPA